MRFGSYLENTKKKKKKLIKILHLLPSNFRTKHFFIKRIIYDLFEIVSLSRHRGRIDRRRKVRTSMRNGMGSAMPIRIGERSLRMLIGAINAANKSLRRRSSLASCRYSKIRPADNYSADGTVVYIDISIRSQSLKLVSFCFCALCIVETAPGSVLKASVWMLCFYG